MTTISQETPLSVLVREGSKAEHQAAEGSSFMSELLAGRIDGAGYAHYLAVLRPVYAALESVGRELTQDPIAGGFVDPELERLAALDADLDFWTKGQGLVVSSPAAESYVARIEAARDDPKLFVAHHYTRYLGDLSGGQAIGRILARTYELEQPEGVQFYEFVAIPKPKPYKDAYRARLDMLPLDEQQRSEVLGEVKDVFALNGALFAELTQVLVVRPLI